MPVFLARPPRQRYWIHVLLLFLTLFTTTVVGVHLQSNFQNNLPAFAADRDSLMSFFPIDVVAKNPTSLLLGLPFSLSLMLILLAHELGHYLYCVYYGVNATLPYFIPFPFLSPFGTLGAFIRVRSPIRSRAALFDIGIAGPIAGFVVACVVLVFALPLSRVVSVVPPADLVLQYPLIFWITQYALTPLGVIHARLGASAGTTLLHPMATAAWVGMFATALNLLPGGQLDGGHIVYSIWPGVHRFISRLTILCLIPMAVYGWSGWLLWAVLLELSCIRQPQVADLPRVAGVRKWLALFSLLMLVLTFWPAPIANSSLKDLIHRWRHPDSGSPIVRKVPSLLRNK